MTGVQTCALPIWFFCRGVWQLVCSPMAEQRPLGHMHIQAAQATRCLVSTLSQVGVHLITSLVPAFISGVPCVSSGELISDCDPPGGCQLKIIFEQTKYYINFYLAILKSCVIFCDTFIEQFWLQESLEALFLEIKGV